MVMVHEWTTNDTAILKVFEGSGQILEVEPRISWEKVRRVTFPLHFGVVYWLI